MYRLFCFFLTLHYDWLMISMDDDTCWQTLCWQIRIRSVRSLCGLSQFITISKLMPPLIYSKCLLFLISTYRVLIPVKASGRWGMFNQKQLTFETFLIQILQVFFPECTQSKFRLSSIASFMYMIRMEIEW